METVNFRVCRSTGSMCGVSSCSSLDVCGNVVACDYLGNPNGRFQKRIKHGSMSSPIWNKHEKGSR